MRGGGMKITEIIFTSFIIKKICLLNSLKTNDLAKHININTTISISSQVFLSVPLHQFSIFTIYLLFLTSQTSKTWKPSSNTLSETGGAPDRNVVASFKDKLNSSQHFKIQNWWFQASVVKEMRSVLFWYVTQGTVVIPYRRFRTNYRSYVRRGKNQNGINRLFWNIVKELTLYAAEHPRTAHLILTLFAGSRFKLVVLQTWRLLVKIRIVSILTTTDHFYSRY